VTRTNSPWADLEVGGVDTRRVSAGARWNWFWAVMQHTDVALVLQLEQFPDPAPELPRLRNLEMGFRVIPSGPIFCVCLKDKGQLELFETLCRDVVAASELASTEAEALATSIGRTFRWHRLLRGGAPNVLSEEEQKGLVGEIEVLSLLVDCLGARPALRAWTGPSGAPKDFELTSGCIEVKARRGASQPFVRISNEFQLADVPGRDLWLAVLTVDRVQPPHGRTLKEIVASVSKWLEVLDPSTIMDWELRLADAGYDPLHDYSNWRWIGSSPEFYHVTEGFPRVAVPMVPIGIKSLTYALSLSACTPFRTDWQDVREQLVEEDNIERA